MLLTFGSNRQQVADREMFAALEEILRCSLSLVSAPRASMKWRNAAYQVGRVYHGARTKYEIFLRLGGIVLWTVPWTGLVTGLACVIDDSF